LPSTAAHAVRLALGSLSDRARLQDGLNTVAKTLKSRSNEFQNAR
jgi:hypothetical protein